VGVNVAPIVPGLTDHEMPAILKEAAARGARFAGYTMIRLPYGVKDLFSQWAAEHFPDRAQKILHKIQELRGGKLNDPNFGSRMRGEGILAKEISDFFKISRRKAGLSGWDAELSTAHFRRPGQGTQLDFQGL
jgi:DNA repair photolyase